MVTEKVKITKHLVQYYLEIEKADTSTFKTLKTTDVDYSPFVEYDEETWQDTEELPIPVILVKTVIVEETDDETGEKSEVTYRYYYTTYSKEEEITRKADSVCSWCIYHSAGTGFRRHLCKHEAHLVKDYIGGIDLPGMCKDYNSVGQCKYFIEDFIKVEESFEEENEPSEETPDVPEADETIPEVEETTNDSE